MGRRRGLRNGLLVVLLVQTKRTVHIYCTVALVCTELVRVEHHHVQQPGTVR